MSSPTRARASSKNSAALPYSLALALYHFSPARTSALTSGDSSLSMTLLEVSLAHWTGSLLVGTVPGLG